MTKAKRIYICGLISAGILFSAVFGIAFGVSDSVFAQESGDSPFIEGEKLTYAISFEKFPNAAYAELSVSSKGTIEGKPAYELQGRLKSLNLVSAAYYLVDRTRTVFASPDTGMPIYVKNISKESGLPIETISNFISEPSTNFDLLTMIYRARKNGGAGTFSVLENGEIYIFDFIPTGGEVVKTVSEQYETSVSSVTSRYFDEIGITDVRINFSNGESRIPVKFVLTTEKGSFSGILASTTIIKPTPIPSVSEVLPSATPISKATPAATPTPYVDNQKLPKNLPFELGESLTYSVKRGGREISRVKFSLEGRKNVSGFDSLIIKGSVVDGANGSLFGPGDMATALINPLTLVPYTTEFKFTGPLSLWNQDMAFDQTKGNVTFGGANRSDVPIGTHSLLSLAYAIRSFNLRPSKDPKNPVNDTRVAVFVENKAYILTLRPSDTSKVEVGSASVSAQLITIITGDPKIDRFRPRVWLSPAPSRVPVKFAIGDIVAELVR